MYYSIYYVSREFVEDCVIYQWKQKRVINQHWMPVMDACNVCQRDFDFFSKFCIA